MVLRELDQQRIDDILDKRAHKIGRDSRMDRRRQLVTSVAVLSVGQKCFGLPLVHIREIMRYPRLAGLPALPTWLSGIMHVRGELIAVLDLAEYLAIEQSFEKKFLAIIDDRTRPLGVIADNLIGFRDIFEEEIH